MRGRWIKIKHFAATFWFLISCFSSISYCAADCEELVANLNEIKNPNSHMNVKRSPKEYIGETSPEAAKLLLPTEKPLWVFDSGTGKALFARHLLLKENLKHLKFVVLSYPLPKEPAYHSDIARIHQELGPDYFTHIHGQLFHEADVHLKYPQFDWWFDHNGVLTYTDNFNRDLSLSFKAVKIGGKLVIAFPIQALQIVNEKYLLPVKYPLSKMRRETRVPLGDFFTQIKGAKVLDMNVEGGLFYVVLEKTAENPLAPALELEELTHGRPPERIFLMQSPQGP